MDNSFKYIAQAFTSLGVNPLLCLTQLQVMRCREVKQPSSFGRRRYCPLHARHIFSGATDNVLNSVGFVYIY